MKILATGAGGLLGRYVIKKLISYGFEVKGFDLFPPPHEFSKIDWIQGDIRDSNKVNDAVKGVDAVFHLAGRMPQWEKRLGENNLYDINVNGTKNVIQSCLSHKVRFIVFASTTEIFGPQKKYPLSEEDTPIFTGAYSRHKFECERLLDKACSQNKIFAISLRLPMIFGEGFYHERSITFIFDLVRLGLPLFLFCDPKIPFTCVHAEDAAEAFILSLKTLEKMSETNKTGKNHDVFNISSEIAPPVIDVFDSFIKKVKSKTKIIKVPLPIVKLGIIVAIKLPFIPLFHTPQELIPFALTGAHYSIKKAKEILGFSPKFTPELCLEQTYNWYVKNRKISFQERKKQGSD